MVLSEISEVTCWKAAGLTSLSLYRILECLAEELAQSGGVMNIYG